MCILLRIRSKCVAKFKWEWADQIAPRTEERWTVDVLNWCPRGIKPTGDFLEEKITGVCLTVLKELQSSVCFVSNIVDIDGDVTNHEKIKITTSVWTDSV